MFHLTLIKTINCRIDSLFILQNNFPTIRISFGSFRWWISAFPPDLCLPGFSLSIPLSPNVYNHAVYLHYSFWISPFCYFHAIFLPSRWAIAQLTFSLTTRISLQPCKTSHNTLCLFFCVSYVSHSSLDPSLTVWRKVEANPLSQLLNEIWLLPLVVSKPTDIF